MAGIDLSTLASVKIWLGEAGTGLDALISSLITSASAYFLTETSLDIGEILGAPYNEKYNGNGQDQLFLAHGPVTSVTSVTIGPVAIPASPDGIRRGYVFDSNVIYLIGYTFWRGAQNVAVQYAIAEPAATPSDISRCIDTIVAAWIRRQGHIDQVSQSLDGQVVGFNKKDIPPEAQVTIDRYKKRVPV